MRRFFGVVTSIAALGVLAACGGGGDAGTGDTGAMATTPAATAAQPTGGMAMALPPGVTAAMVAQGDSIFHGAGLCLSCHGPDAKGTTLAPDLTDETWLNLTGRNYDEIVALVTTGVATPKQYPSPMIARGGSQITDDQVKAVAAYVYSLGQH
jgi:mono/diheme cytochrome c family protein